MTPRSTIRAMPDSDLTDTWNISNRINLYVLAAVGSEVLTAKPAKGRSIAEMFAHVHNVRIDWLKAAAPDLIGNLAKIEKEALSAEALAAALAASGGAVAGLIERGIESGRVKGFKPHPSAYVGYMVAHDAYHRGEIGTVASQLGHPLDKKTSFGMWEWGVR